MGASYLPLAGIMPSMPQSSTSQVMIAPTRDINLRTRSSSPSVATSIIADGEEIHPHPRFTKSIGYEGKIGVIIGQPGFKVSQEDTMDYV